MTPTQWSRLRRGDLVRHVAHPKHIHTVLAVRPEAVLTNITEFALSPADWLQVNDRYEVIDERGRVIPAPEQECRMCDGAGVAHYDGVMQTCPRCAGQCLEPANIEDQVIELRIWYPTGAEFPQVIFTAETPLHHGQIVELLTRALQIMRGTTPDQFREGKGTVN